MSKIIVKHKVLVITTPFFWRLYTNVRYVFCARRLPESRGTLPFTAGLSTLQALLKSHNIGIPVEIREREMNQKAARLVGLQLPPKG